ncbi:MAG: DUF512 domain-containing protein, partial [Actinomycetota bacterium]|nr:DUF512 domain-containing protein [Actinomycetota bacterium]
FYVIGGVDFPSYGYYKNFYQMENGIGKSTFFLKQIKDYMEKNMYKKKYKKHSGRNNKKNHILLVTSEYGKAVIRSAIDIISQKSFKNVKDMASRLEIMEVKNKFFCGNIKITGLLSWEDIKGSLEKRNINNYYRILIPDSIFNEDGLSIDNYKDDDFRKINRNIRIVPEEGYSFVKEIFSN